jgi:hypothetical protein
MLTFLAIVACLCIFAGALLSTGTSDSFGPRMLIVGMLLLLIWSAIPAKAKAHDADNPEFDSWYAELMQPDNPTASCCGKADAYWCEDIHFKRARRSAPSRMIVWFIRRPPVPVGTEIEIPDRKLKWDRGNPTGHSIVFLSSGGAVFCFVQNGGV